MMKKLTAVLLCIVLALGCAMAFAEAPAKEDYTEVTVNGSFLIRGLTPDGYKADGVANEGMPILMFFANEDETKPFFELAVNFREEFSGVEKLNDLSEADRALLIAEDFTVDPAYTVMKTEHDTEVMVLRSAFPEDLDFVSFVTLYKGYEVGLNLFPGEASDGHLTDDQIALAMKFLSDLDFEPIS
jgi:hypothetical protein